MAHRFNGVKQHYSFSDTAIHFCSSRPFKLCSILFIIFLMNSCGLFKSKHSSKTYNRLTNDIITTARSYTGTPYRSGGLTEKGMDCSGLLFTTFKSVGLQLPRTSWQQAETGQEVRLSEVRPGDLLFFVTNKKGAGAINHSGIVTEVRKDEIRFIHSSTSKGVREDNLYTDYWRAAFAKAVRPF